MSVKFKVGDEVERVIGDTVLYSGVIRFYYGARQWILVSEDCGTYCAPEKGLRLKRKILFTEGM